MLVTTTTNLLIRKPSTYFRVLSGSCKAVSVLTQPILWCPPTPCRPFPRGCAAHSRFSVSELTQPPAHPLTRSPAHPPTDPLRTGDGAAPERGLNSGRKKTPLFRAGRGVRHLDCQVNCDLESRAKTGCVFKLRLFGGLNRGEDNSQGVGQLFGFRGNYFYLLLCHARDFRHRGL